MDTYFDIETAPLPDAELVSLADPFVPPAHPGQFSPESVAYGNLKDEVKRAAKLEQAKADHAAAVLGYEQAVVAAKAEWLAGLRDKAALSALTGSVLAIGYLRGGKFSAETIGSPGAAFPEADVLQSFWLIYKGVREKRGRMIGLNISDFDLPFLVRRSWMLGVEVPNTVLSRDYRYFDPAFVDLRKCWLLGQWSKETRSGFDTLAAAFGTDGKFEGRSGKDFHKLYREDYPKAMGYLRSDVEQLAAWAEKMGVVSREGAYLVDAPF